jgi:uncharacterized protein
LRLRLNALLRWLHIYTSMLCLIVVLFFSLTGITLNHPDWSFGRAESRQTVTGTLPTAWKTGTEINWLTTVEYLRATNGAQGNASDTRSDSTGASVRFSAPGSTADAQIDVKTGTYTFTTNNQGFLGMLEDFHRGRYSGAAWAWLIDLSGGFLALISVTGLGLLFYLKKIRLPALLIAAGGGVVMIGLMHLAAR